MHRIDLAKSLRAEGRRWREIADACGVSVTTVRRWVRGGGQKNYSALWRSRHPEYRDRHNALERARRAKSPEKYRAYDRSRRVTPEGWAKRSMGNIKAGAKRRGLECSISAADILQALPEDLCCPVFHTPFKFGGTREDTSPSVDRIDSARGYVASNVAVISDRANRIKNNGTAAEHQAIAEWMIALKAHAEKR